MVKFISLDNFGDLYSFYLIEVWLFILLYIIAAFGQYKYGAIPLLLIIGYIFFVVERKRIFILDKEKDKLLAIEKAMFQNKYRIVEQNKFSNIRKAYLHQVSWTKSVKYNLGILLKNGESIYPFGGFCNVNPYWIKRVEKVNDFILQNNETHLEMNYNSFLFRIIGILILSIHLFSLLSVIIH